MKRRRIVLNNLFLKRAKKTFKPRAVKKAKGTIWLMLLTAETESRERAAGMGAKMSQRIKKR